MENNEIIQEEISAIEEQKDEVTLLKEHIERLEAENEMLRSQIEKKDIEQETAVYEREDWKDKLSSFLILYPEAKEKAKEIASELISSNDIACKPNALEIAYITVLKKNKSPENLMEDDEFLKSHVYVSKKVRDKIIADYVAEIEKGAPSVMAKGGEVYLTPPVKPRTLRDVKVLAEKYLS